MGGIHHQLMNTHTHTRTHTRTHKRTHAHTIVFETLPDTDYVASSYKDEKARQEHPTEKPTDVERSV